MSAQRVVFMPGDGIGPEVATVTRAHEEVLTPDLDGQGNTEQLTAAIMEALERQPVAS